MDERTVNMVACVLWDLPFSGEDKPHTIDGLRGLQAVRIDCDIHFRPKLFESNAPKEIFEEQVAARLLEIGIRRTSDPSAPCLSVVIRCMQLPKKDRLYLFAIRSRLLLESREMWRAAAMCGLPTIQYLWRDLPKAFYAQVDVFIHDFLQANEHCHRYN